MKTTHVQSIIGAGTLDLGLLSAGLQRKHTQTTPAVVAWNGWTYLVGAGVERFARPVERQDFQRLSDAVELRALTYKTLYDLVCDLPPEERNVAVMVGYPVEVMADAAGAKAARKGLRAWLEDTHTFQVDGETITVTVTKVHIMAQPAGTFYAWGFDDRGQWIRAKDDLRALVGVCDIGFNTLDLFTVQGGEIQGRFTGGDSLGMRRAAERVIQAVKREHGVTLSKHQADALLRERKPQLMTAGHWVDLSSVVEQAHSTNAGAILTFLEEQWGNGLQFGYALFTGGGAAQLQDTLLAHYPHGNVMHAPVTANALGLARAGYRMMQRYAPHIIGLDPGYGGFKGVLL